MNVFMCHAPIEPLSFSAWAIDGEAAALCVLDETVEAGDGLLEDFISIYPLATFLRVPGGIE
jgi:hypothetical protein